MRGRLIEILLLAGFLTIAVLLHRSTASYPSFVQGSTASYVRFLAVSLGVLSAAQLLISWRSRAVAEGGTGGGNPQRFWALLILLGLYSWALGPFGFFAASAAFLPLTMVAMGARRPLPIILNSAAILAFVYFIFVKLLAVHLPKGTLF